MRTSTPMSEPAQTTLTLHSSLSAFVRLLIAALLRYACAACRVRARVLCLSESNQWEHESNQGNQAISHSCDAEAEQLNIKCVAQRPARRPPPALIWTRCVLCSPRLHSAHPSASCRKISLSRCQRQTPAMWRLPKQPQQPSLPPRRKQMCLQSWHLLRLRPRLHQSLQQLAR